MVSRTAVIAAGCTALVAALPLMLVRGVDNVPDLLHHPNETPAARGLGLTALLTPTIIGLSAFFALLSLSGSGISNFSVVALTSAFGTARVRSSSGTSICRRSRGPIRWPSCCTGGAGGHAMDWDTWDSSARP